MKNIKSASKNLLLLAASVFVLTNTAMGQMSTSTNKAGTTAAQFLKIAVGSRAVGMGGAFTTMPGDLNAIYWNPAGIARIYSRQANFNHIDWIMDVNYDYSSAAMYIDEFGTVGAFVSVLSMGDMLVRTIEKPEGTGERFTYSTLMAGVSYARNLTENFAIGFNAKYIRENLYNESAYSIAFDIGTLYTIPVLNEFRLGASISNFGPKMTLDGRDILVINKVGAGEGNLINNKTELDAFDLPLTFRIGVAADIVKQEEHKITVAIDAIHPNDNTESINTGAEYSYNDILFLRGGYKALFERHTEQGLTLGFGVQYQLIESVKMMVDYAYQDFGRLNMVHYISIGVKF